MKSNAWIKSKASGATQTHLVKCFATPTHLMVIMSATQALGNKDKLSSLLIEGKEFSLSRYCFPICPRALFVLQ